MITDPLQGFVSKPEATRIIGRDGRTVTGWIADALENGDAEFLGHLKLRTKDGNVFDGTTVTKGKVGELNDQGMIPRWYVEQSFAEALKTKDSTSKQKSRRQTKKSAGESSAYVKLTGATEIQTLQHELAIERERNLATVDKVESLTADKQFLEAELESRRDDIEELKELFQSIGTAADSTAKLQTGKSDASSIQDVTEEGTAPAKDSDTIEATATSVTAKNEDFWIKNTPNLPTFGKALSSLSKSFSRFERYSLDDR